MAIVVTIGMGVLIYWLVKTTVKNRTEESKKQELEFGKRMMEHQLFDNIFKK